MGLRGTHDLRGVHESAATSIQVVESSSNINITSNDSSVDLSAAIKIIESSGQITITVNNPSPSINAIWKDVTFSVTLWSDVA